VAVIMKHMAGNMFSRWTDFLTTDGEKSNRNRDMEFVIESNTSKLRCSTTGSAAGIRFLPRLSHYAEKTWKRKFDSRRRSTQSFRQSTVSLMHYANHIGQIVFLAKHFRSAEWKC